jgi:hypothetical protein
MRSIRVVAAVSAVLVHKPRLQSDIAGYLHAGAGPVLEQMYEGGQHKVSEKWRSLILPRGDFHCAAYRRVDYLSAAWLGKKLDAVFPTVVRGTV